MKPTMTANTNQRIPSAFSLALGLLGLSFGALIGLSSSPVVGDALPALIGIFSAIVGAAGVMGFRTVVMKRAGIILSVFVATAILGLVGGIGLRVSEVSCGFTKNCQIRIEDLDSRRTLIAKENLLMLDAIGALELWEERLAEGSVDYTVLQNRLVRIQDNLALIREEIIELTDETGALLPPKQAGSQSRIARELAFIEGAIAALIEGDADPAAVATVLRTEVTERLPEQISLASKLVRGLKGESAQSVFYNLSKVTIAISTDVDEVLALLLSDADVLNGFLFQRLLRLNELGNVVTGDSVSERIQERSGNLLEGLSEND